MTASAADLAATVREGFDFGERPAFSRHRDALAALDSLLARCEQAERERDRLASEQTAWRNYVLDAQGRAEAAERERDEALKRAEWLYQDADAKYNEIRSLERERDEAQEALQSLAADHYFARAEAAEAEAARLRGALKPFAEKWDLHAAPYLADGLDGEEARVLTARTVAEMIEDIRAARAALEAGE